MWRFIYLRSYASETIKSLITTTNFDLMIINCFAPFGTHAYARCTVRITPVRGNSCRVQLFHPVKGELAMRHSGVVGTTSERSHAVSECRRGTKPSDRSFKILTCGRQHRKKVPRSAPERTSSSAVDLVRRLRRGRGNLDYRVSLQNLTLSGVSSAGRSHHLHRFGYST